MCGRWSCDGLGWGRAAPRFAGARTRGQNPLFSWYLAKSFLGIHKSKTVSSATPSQSPILCFVHNSTPFLPTPISIPPPPPLIPHVLPPVKTVWSSLVPPCSPLPPPPRPPEVIPTPHRVQFLANRFWQDISRGMAGWQSLNQELEKLVIN